MRLVYNATEQSMIKEQEAILQRNTWTVAHPNSF